MATPARTEPWQPPRTLWGETWRLGLSLLVSLLVWLEVAEQQVERPVLFLLDVALGVVALVLVLVRRRWPVAVGLLVTAMAGVSAWAAGLSVLAGISLATHRRWRSLVALAAVSIAATFAYPAVQPTTQEPSWVTALVAITITAAIVATGMYIGSRRELMWTLRQRAERAEAEQQLRADRARRQERERIAREMHDVLGHRISLLAVHAGALAYRDDLGPDEVRASAEVIGASAHRAMQDLRAVLGVLRDVDDAPDLPQPTLPDVPSLLVEARDAGMRIDLVDDLEDDGPPPAETTGRTVYRIIQEGLTNARRHAPGTLVRVTIAGDPTTGIAVRMTNPLPLTTPPTEPGSGMGLVGLAERASLAGGWLRHRHDPDGFTLQAWLPWTTEG